MPALPAARGLARAGRAREARGVRRRDVLGPPGRPASATPARALLVLGLAPAAHGANRTGRVFTGDRSGDFLFAALHRAGFANQPTSASRDDGLRADRRLDRPPRCAARRPRTGRRRRSATPACRGLARELALLPRRARSSVPRRASPGTPRCALRAAPGRRSPRPRPRFGHGARGRRARRAALLGCFHPSQQNTFTGRLTPAMLDEVLGRALALSAATAPPTSRLSGPGSTLRTAMNPRSRGASAR